ncbi:MAG: RNA methyltransferase [Desulfovibrio sp.]|uniref:TrmH family RNA methyltransferase n=1 Tax=Desulfovibrio sp. TaxID=885 RepID=UPI001A6E75A3|nr:RNA methyltransferase [Desulfovibrio sp.]MBD5418022.1 RNA methyltransferase [Desulfovibrio sp.]
MPLPHDVSPEGGAAPDGIPAEAGAPNENPDAPGRPVTPRRRARLRQVLSQRQPDLTLVLANIHDPHNVSAIYRSCDAFGVARVHLYYTNTPFPALGRKSSASARKWVESERHRDKEALFAALHGQGMQVLATSCSPEARPLRAWDFLRPTAVILGNEHEGVDESLLAAADGRLYIPMHGMIQSFNVSVAAAIILAEAARQREAAGWYDAPRMDGVELEATLADWLQR